MTRRQAIATTGVAGASLLVARSQAGAWLERAVGVEAARAQATPQCVLTGTRTEGPYYVDEKLNRSDIREDTSDGSIAQGVPFVLTFVVLDNDNRCAPIAGAQVDVWHCNARGAYSDIDGDQAGGGNTDGRTYLRGAQVTDADGRCAFTTVFPGWYPGRSVHIHFKIRSGSDQFDSQLFFDEGVVQRINARGEYKGNDGRTTNAQDGIYGSDGASLIVEVAGDDERGYAGTYTVGLAGFASGGGGEDTAVAAAIGEATFDRTRSGKRILRFPLRADERVSVEARLVRGGRVLARRRIDGLPAGSRTVRVVVPRRTAKGGARLKVLVTDAAGNRRAVNRMVRVPRIRG